MLSFYTTDSVMSCPHTGQIYSTCDQMHPVSEQSSTGQLSSPVNMCRSVRARRFMNTSAAQKFILGICENKDRGNNGNLLENSRSPHSSSRCKVKDFSRRDDSCAFRTTLPPQLCSSVLKGKEVLYLM